MLESKGIFEKGLTVKDQVLYTPSVVRYQTALRPVSPCFGWLFAGFGAARSGCLRALYSALKRLGNCWIFPMILVAGCESIPPQIDQINSAVWRDWTPSLITVDNGSGRFQGDCSAFADRAAALAEAKGLPTESCMTWNLGEAPHEWTAVQLAGEWWAIDNMRRRPYRTATACR